MPSPFRDFAVVGELPHDPEGYAQGLALLGGAILEGTGRYGQSVCVVST